MNPPLLEVNLEIRFEQLEYRAEQLQYFAQQNAGWLRLEKKVEEPAVAWFAGPANKDKLILSRESLQLESTRGVSWPRLRADWVRLLKSVADIFGVCRAEQVSLSYLNEIPVEDLHSFRNYLNIGFEMPSLLKERIEFFRSEFMYRYPFGDIHVWLQPDWDDQVENYCIQLSIESRIVGSTACEELEGVLQQLHDGNKDVFHQVLSQDYIGRLPQ